MTGITVHGIPGSPFLRSVEIALKEKALDYELRAMAPGEHKQPGYPVRHPFGRIPAFDHDGFAIYETQAIIRYVDDVFPIRRSPPAMQRRAPG
jgi:glutathione S-transferase